MKFLVDAQLPRRLARWLISIGHDALHTLDLPLQNRTPDLEGLRIANTDGRIVITKDDDFILFYRFGKGPPGLLFIATGNISNDEFLDIFQRHQQKLFETIGLGKFVELTRTSLIIHE